MKYLLLGLVVFTSTLSWASLPFTSGDYYGGGVVSFSGSPFAGPYAGLTAPYSIHISVTEVSLNKATLTLDNSLSSSGQLVIKLIDTGNSQLEILDIQDKAIGTATCKVNSCELSFIFPTITAAGVPISVKYSANLTAMSAAIIQVGSASLGSSVIYNFNDKLKVQL